MDINEAIILIIIYGLPNVISSLVYAVNKLLKPDKRYIGRY